MSDEEDCEKSENLSLDLYVDGEIAERLAFEPGEEFEARIGGCKTVLVRPDEDTAEDRSLEELEKGLEKSVQDAAEGRTYTTEEAREEVRKRREETSEKSPELEPTAFEYLTEDGGFRQITKSRYGRYWLRESRFHEQAEPLVRISDVISVLEIVEREAEAYTTAEEDPVMAFKHGSKLVLANIRELLKEFAQKGESE